METGTMDQEYTIEDCAKHSSRKDLWLVIHGRVYDITSWLEDHPGGIEVLMEVAHAEDASPQFDQVGHSDFAKSILPKYCIGKIKGAKLDDPLSEESHVNETANIDESNDIDNTWTYLITASSIATIAAIGTYAARSYSRHF